MATQQRAAREAAAQSRGMRNMLLLVVLTLVEYLAAVEVQSSTLLVLVLVMTPIALLKGWVIVMAFMHFARVWRGEGEHA